MNTCPHCHIRVGGDTAYCPLCQNRLSGPAGEPYFPATAPRIHRASLLYKVVAFVLSALIVVAGAFDFLLMEDTPHRHFSILMAVWAVAVLRVLRAVLRRRFNGPRPDLQSAAARLGAARLYRLVQRLHGVQLGPRRADFVLCSAGLQLYFCLPAQSLYSKRARVSAHEHRHRRPAVHSAVLPH